MSVATTAAARRHKTPRIEASARAGQSFEPKPAALMGQHSLRVTGRARGALAIDVPRIMAAAHTRLALCGHGSGGRDIPDVSRPASAGIMAASPCGRVATPAVGEQGLERLRVKRSPLLPPERGA